MGYSLETIETYSNFFMMPKQKGILVYNEPHFGKPFPLIIWINNDAYFPSDIEGRRRLAERYFCFEKILDSEDATVEGIIKICRTN